jgi:hypothetical protein
MYKSQFKQVNKNCKHPIASYYGEIHWENGFERWDLVRFSTPMDGNCLFHAIANSFFTGYHEEKIDDVHIDRNKIITLFRKELSEKLGNTVTASSKKTNYEMLCGENMVAFAKEVPEFSLKTMQKQLNSNNPIGYGYMEFIGNCINKDIYILEGIRRDIYVTDELYYSIKGDRSSIILYYTEGHYELVGVRHANDTYETHFSPNNPLIRFLYDRVRASFNQG